MLGIWRRRAAALFPGCHRRFCFPPPLEPFPCRLGWHPLYQYLRSVICSVVPHARALNPGAVERRPTITMGVRFRSHRFSRWVPAIVVAGEELGAVSAKSAHRGSRLQHSSVSS